MTFGSLLSRSLYAFGASQPPDEHLSGIRVRRERLRHKVARSLRRAGDGLAPLFMTNANRAGRHPAN